MKIKIESELKKSLDAKITQVKEQFITEEFASMPEDAARKCGVFASRAPLRARSHKGALDAKTAAQLRTCVLIAPEDQGKDSLASLIPPQGDAL